MRRQAAMVMLHIPTATESHCISLPQFIKRMIALAIINVIHNRSTEQEGCFCAWAVGLIIQILMRQVPGLLQLLCECVMAQPGQFVGAEAQKGPGWLERNGDPFLVCLALPVTALATADAGKDPP